MIRSLNPAAERIFRCRADDVIGQPLAMLMPEHLRGLHAAGRARCLTMGKAHVLGQAMNVPARRHYATTADSAPNAVKSTEHSEVELTMQGGIVSGDALAFSEQDMGIGISAEVVNQPEATRAPAIATDQPDVRPLHILLAEDNLVNQKLAVRLLQRMGCPARLVVSLVGRGHPGGQRPAGDAQILGHRGVGVPAGTIPTALSRNFGVSRLRLRGPVVSASSLEGMVARRASSIREHTTPDATLNPDRS